MDTGRDKSKEGLVTVTYDDSSSMSHFRGKYVVTMESGDKIFAPFQGTQPLKEGKPGESRGYFSHSGGTGKTSPCWHARCERQRSLSGRDVGRSARESDRQRTLRLPQD